jgi:hypothetical protein
MKKLGVVAVVCVGFIAGIAFVYSCGGGSSAEAVTDVTGIETRLDTISNQITSLHNSITGADIMTIKVLDFVSVPDGSSIFSNPISVAGYKEIYFISPPGTSVLMYAHHTAGGMTQRIPMGDYGTMPSYGDTVVFEAYNLSGAGNASLVIKLVP